MAGKFIVFEGLDGSGKSTQIRCLEQRLRDMGRRVDVTAEPTVSALGGLVRDALSGFTPRSGGEIAALFMADRVQHNVNPVWGIQKMLASGFDVICDRYYYSSMAYQGTVTDPDWVERINLDCPEIRRPDLCVFLDVDYERCRRRMEEGRAFLEIYENEASMIATRRRYYAVFEELKERDRIAVIDAGRPVEEVAEDVFRAVLPLFSGNDGEE
ncbi:MAG: dTMP kinase [Oscillospiraceae bacterium]|nr:dTMP kinase [bacterium]MDY5101049.1 dTMP kinase [Oscillospiraceae bacterium]